MKKTVLIAAITVLMVMLMAGTAFASHSVTTGEAGDRIGNYDVIKNLANGCNECHGGAPTRTVGPHGGYATGTRKCLACHEVHSAKSTLLLPGATVTEACNFCHDLTGTDVAPYYASDLTNPSYYNKQYNNTGTVKSSHRVFSTLTVPSFVYNFTYYGFISIPGGDSATGGSADLDTSTQGQLSGNSGVNGEFTCDSCHTPHALVSSTVYGYLGENETSFKNGTGKTTFYATNRILKNTVNGNFVGYTYGSAWCAGCHAGRTDDHGMSNVSGAVYNHPVNEGAPAYDFVNNLPAGVTLVSSTPYTETVTGVAYYVVAGSGARNFDKDFRSNKWWTMEPNDPLRTGNPLRDDGAVAYAAGTGPACQQCHGNPRNIDAGPYMSDKTAGAPVEGSGAPSRYTFPHMSTNAALLVSDGDDFCTNCHGTSNLP